MRHNSDIPYFLQRNLRGCVLCIRGLIRLTFLNLASPCFCLRRLLVRGGGFLFNLLGRCGFYRLPRRKNNLILKGCAAFFRLILYVRLDILL